MIGVSWHTATRQVLDTVFPPKCVGCAARGHWICPACLRRVDRLAAPVCGVCGQPIEQGASAHGCRQSAAPLVAIHAVGVHAGPLRKAVHALKYSGRHGVAATLAALLAPNLAAYVAAGDLLAPVPLHPERERERGYNQAAILARELAFLVPLELEPAALRRTRATAQQASLSGARRQANVRNAFEARPDLVRGRRIWLLDDVSTTGATLRECAGELRAKGAREVRGAVVALAL